MKVVKKWLPFVVVGVIATMVASELMPWYRKGRAMLTSKVGGAK